MKSLPKIHIGLLLASIGAFAAATGAYAYLYHDAFVHADHAIVARNAAAAEGQREKQSKDIMNLVSSTAASRVRLAELFVPAADAVGFIQAMESIGDASGATVSISSITETVPDSSKKAIIGSLTAHIAMSGSWTQVMNALELFEVLPYKVKIDRLTLDTSLGSGDKPGSVRAWQAGFDISASTLTSTP